MTNGETLSVSQIIRSEINIAHVYNFQSNKLAKIRKITH